MVSWSRKRLPARGWSGRGSDLGSGSARSGADDPCERGARVHRQGGPLAIHAGGVSAVSFAAAPVATPQRARMFTAGVAAAAVGAAAAGTVALVHGAARDQTTTLAAVTLLAALSFVGSGLVAWRRRPEVWTGALMVAAGFCMLASSLANFNSAVPFTIGLVVAPVGAAVIAHLVLSFPDGRLHSRPERVVVAGAYVVTIPLQVVMLMLMGESVGINRHGAGDERALQRRSSQSRWPRVMRWRPARAQRSVDRGRTGGAIEPRNNIDSRVPTSSPWRKARLPAALLASRWWALRGQRSQARTTSSMHENREISWSPAGCW